MNECSGSREGTNGGFHMKNDNFIIELFNQNTIYVHRRPIRHRPNTNLVSSLVEIQFFRIHNKLFAQLGQ